jgi:hypothetical protein
MNAIEFPADPSGRFVQIYEALSPDRGWFVEHSSLRFAALTTTTCPGEPADVAAAIQSLDRELQEARRWYEQFPRLVRFTLAATLHRNGDTVPAFLEELERVGRIFRDVGLGRGGLHEVSAILILRSRRELEPVTEEDVRRVKVCFDEMKRHHPWITGGDDYPACAVIAGLDDVPEAAVARAEEIYEALRGVGCSKGNQLQAAANLLAVSGDPSHVLAERFAALEKEFEGRGLHMHAGDYGQLAVLGFLAHPVMQVADRVLEHREVMSRLRPDPGKEMTFDFAVGTAFLDLCRRGRDLQEITDLSTLLQIQAVIQSQQMALIAVVVAST